MILVSDAVNEAVDISSLEVARGEIGEIVVSGWHVNTYQVKSHSSLCLTHTHACTYADSLILSLTY